VDIVGDKWSLLIIRDAFDGVRRFSQFQRSLGIAKNILSSRLSALVEAGIMRVEPASDGTSYHEYVLTDKGLELFDLIVALRQWGERNAFEPGEQYRSLTDVTTGEPLARISYVRPDGRPLRYGETRLGDLQPAPADPT
jgi:DNA-binding HxlR family transcriptional regulator